MSFKKNNEDASYNPRQLYTFPCYFDDLVTVKDIGITCYDRLIDFVQTLEIILLFLVGNQNVSLIACNFHVAVQVVEYGAT